VEVIPKHPTIGAELPDVDLAAGVDDTLFGVIEAALRDHKVIVFPDQNLDEAAQIAFSRRFGDLEIYPQSFSAERGFPEIFMVSSVDEDGRLLAADTPRAKFLRLTEIWHSDSSYQQVPSLGSILYCVEEPRRQGDTQFADMVAALAAMPAALRRRIEGRRAVHSFMRSRAIDPSLPPLSEAERARVPDAAHPLIRSHGDGRESLFIGGWASHVEGMEPEESAALLEELTAWATRQEFIYRHRWRTGDLLMWDNRTTMHQAEGFDRTRIRRIMRRTTVKGLEAVA